MILFHPVLLETELIILKFSHLQLADLSCLSPSLEWRLQALDHLLCEPFHKGTFSPVLPFCSRKWVLKKERNRFQNIFSKEILGKPRKIFNSTQQRNNGRSLASVHWASLPHFLTHDSNANSLKGSQCLMLVRQGGHWPPWTLTKHFDKICKGKQIN